jgi:hypothetical protein
LAGWWRGFILLSPILFTVSMISASSSVHPEVESIREDSKSVCEERERKSNGPILQALRLIAGGQPFLDLPRPVSGSS